MIPVAFVVLLVVENSLSNPMANKYVENVLSTTFINAVKELNFDPAALPDFQTESLGEMAGRVEAEFFNGSLRGLSTAKRFSHCSFGTISRAINCTISFDDLKIHYDGKMKFRKAPDVAIQGKAKLFGTVIFMEIVHTPPMPPTLKSVTFDQMGKMKVKFITSRDSSHFTSYLKVGFKGHVQAKVYNLMSKKLPDALKRAVELSSPPLY